MTLLRRLEAEAAGYALAPATSPSLFDAARISELGPSTIGDIRDSLRLAEAMSAAAPETVVHLAAQALVRPARADPIETLSTNVVGTAQVLEAVRVTNSVTAVVVVTSDKVYENREWPWAYREGDTLGGKEPYGASKACTEIVVEAYRHSYFSNQERPMRLVTVRAGNVIGGGDWAADRIIPDAVRAFSQGRPLVVRNPSAVRPWQHVLEPLSGYLQAAQALLEGTVPADTHAFNFGPYAEDAVPVREIADQAVRRWGNGAAWYQDCASHAYEARFLEVDSALARARLGWAPRWRLGDALDRTIDWYKAFYEGKNMLDVTLAQIDEFLGG
jgi:CDP-glucose 4,6-dehydratase